jgi:hypothetical protein
MTWDGSDHRKALSEYALQRFKQEVRAMDRKEIEFFVDHHCDCNYNTYDGQIELEKCSLHEFAAEAAETLKRFIKHKGGGDPMSWVQSFKELLDDYGLFHVHHAPDITVKGWKTSLCGTPTDEDNSVNPQPGITVDCQKCVDLYIQQRMAIHRENYRGGPTHE